MIVIGIAAIASPVFAVTLVSNPTGTSINGVSFIPSTNVNIEVASDDTAYVATSANLSSATDAGYEFQMWNTDNGIWKKKWADAGSPTTAANWPEPGISVSSGVTTTVGGFAK